MGLFTKPTAEEILGFMDNDYDPNYTHKQNVMKTVYGVILGIYIIVGISSLIVFYRLRNWYVIKQRNFKLTMINGIFAFFSGFMTLLVQIRNVPCPISLYVSDVVNPFYNAIFLSRSLRIVLLYRFNIFKVTAMKRSRRNRIRESFSGEKEPNNYLPKVYKRVDKIIYAVIIIPTIIALVITVIVHIRYRSECPFSTKSNAVDLLKTTDVGKLFSVAQYFGMIMAVALIIMIFLLSKVKDSSKYGAKFECISTSILIIVITTFNAFLNSNVNPLTGCYNGKKNGIMNAFEGNLNKPPQEQLNSIILNQVLNGNPEGDPTDEKNKACKIPYNIFLKIYEYTKGGRVLFCIISMYMIFSSIILPCIKCYNSKKEKNKYFHEPTSSIQYFYKVLNSPPLIEELKSIAIKEFSVENVLFWENYQVLQKMVYRYQVEFRKAEKIGNPRLVSQYDFEGYYQQQLQTFSVSSMDDYSYDPNMPVPREIMPYYINFYHTFIDSLGPASVNISGASIKQIYNEMCTYPTIGMFDNAKNEIVEMMYSSIFPILLRQNRKQLRSTLVNY